MRAVDGKQEINLEWPYSKTLVQHDFKAYNLSLQPYNLRKFLKIVQSCTGVVGPLGKLQ